MEGLRLLELPHHFPLCAGNGISASRCLLCGSEQVVGIAGLIRDAPASRCLGGKAVEVHDVPPDLIVVAPYQREAVRCVSVGHQVCVLPLRVPLPGGAVDLSAAREDLVHVPDPEVKQLVPCMVGQEGRRTLSGPGLRPLLQRSYPFLLGSSIVPVMRGTFTKVGGWGSTVGCEAYQHPAIRQKTLQPQTWILRTRGDKQNQTGRGEGGGEQRERERERETETETERERRRGRDRETERDRERQRERERQTDRQTDYDGP